MAKRGRRFKTDVKVSVEDIHQAKLQARYDTGLWKRAQPHTRPGDLKRFVHDESVRTGICRTKLFGIIRRITLRNATGVIWLSGHRDTHGKKP
jgi:hypothetical protein